MITWVPKSNITLDLAYKLYDTFGIIIDIVKFKQEDVAFLIKEDE